MSLLSDIDWRQLVEQCWDRAPVYLRARIISRNQAATYVTYAVSLLAESFPLLQGCRLGASMSLWCVSVDQPVLCGFLGYVNVSTYAMHCEAMLLYGCRATAAAYPCHAKMTAPACY